MNLEIKSLVSEIEKDIKMKEGGLSSVDRKKIRDYHLIGIHSDVSWSVSQQLAQRHIVNL